MDSNQLALVRLAVLASYRAYSIGILSPDKELPEFGGFGLVGKLAEFVSGDKDIDAAFVAKTNDATVVSFRGTLPPTAHPQSLQEFCKISEDWMNDAAAKLVTRTDYPGEVHLGFSTSLEGLLEKGLIDEVKRQAADGKPVIITGHSKGGALASLAAVEFQKAGIGNLQSATFGSPRTGDGKFATEYNKSFPDHLRVVNQDDIVPHVPPTTNFLFQIRNLPEQLSAFQIRPYAHVGKFEFIETDGRLVERDEPNAFEKLERLAKLTIGRKLQNLFEDHFIKESYVTKVMNSN